MSNESNFPSQTAKLAGIVCAKGYEELDADAAFLDTAAVMRCLDLVITCDTATAHLAGALGVQTWLALKYVPDWRWMLDRADSPWYPSVKLYRQASIDEWAPVFKQMKIDISLIE